ncbi:glycosyltransferase [Agromyces humatus]|uniref:Glycosyltransferase subfamily 4-like N-terminal domain-containing protein n=1 Tax=Agromyces humatus TaxID=279573 RepID=A0ABN2K737_9MICO|nr:glycosyltransferase [Agromyces humatus]
MTTPPTYEASGVTAPRIAFVVYNDVHRDTRVRRIAKAAVDAGAEVRIFAFGGARVSQYAVGVERDDAGYEIERVPIASIGHVLVDAGQAVRRMLRRGRRASPQRPAGSSVQAAPAQQSPTAEGVPAIDPGPRAGEPAGPRGAKGWVITQWRRADRTVRQFSFWRNARRAVKRWNPVLVHTHDANTLRVATHVARRLRIPFVYDSHELWTHRNVSADRPVAKRLEGPMERRGARRAAAVITVSPSIAEWLQRNYSLRELPTLVRNIPPFDGRGPDPSSGRLHELAGLPADARVVVYCGGITFNRGIERVIEAVPHLAQGTHFVLLGEGTEVYVGGLRRLIERVGVADRVHFAGAVDSAAVSAALADADVSVALTQPTVLSYEYSLPNKLFESVHAGLPVITSNTKDAAAIVREYGLGQVVDPNASPVELAAAIESIVPDAARYREAARAAARELTWQHEAARLIDLHNRVLAESRAGRRAGRTPRS